MNRLRSLAHENINRPHLHGMGTCVRLAQGSPLAREFTCRSATAGDFFGAPRNQPAHHRFFSASRDRPRRPSSAKRNPRPSITDKFGRIFGNTNRHLTANTNRPKGQWGIHPTFKRDKPAAQSALPRSAGPRDFATDATPLRGASCAVQPARTA